MQKLPRISSKKALAVLLRNGFYVHHQTGGHVHLRHDGKQHLRLVIPMHGRELAPKTLKAIIVQAGLTIREFLKFL